MSLKFAPPPEATPTINVALIGPPKAGKTTGASSAPGPVLYLNCDLPTATRFARRRHGDNVEEVVFEGLQTLADIAMEVCNPNTDFKTVVIDPVGELYRQLLEERSKRAIRPSLPEYGDVAVYLERFLRAMCEAPTNAVFVCHDHPVKDEASGETQTFPFTGSTGNGGIKLGRQLLGMVDVIGFTGLVINDEGKKEALAQLTSNKGRPGGDRFDVLAGETGMRRLDLSEWIDAIRTAEEAEAQGGADNDNSEETK